MTGTGHEPRVTSYESRLLGTLALLAVLALTGCASPAYYWQATSGHLSLMQQRQPVQEILADPTADEELQKQLELAGEILEFAERELALPAGESYRSLVEVNGPVTWNVIATPEFSMNPETWCFPVAGCVAYRGYFDRAKALAFAKKLERRGLDVSVLPAAAYSTLGWFADPLLNTMLDQDAAQLAGTLFHELAHQRLYINDDTRFNESYASFVETAGVERWLATRVDGDEQLISWRREQAAEVEFTHLLQDAREELASVYDSGDSETAMRDQKAAILQRLRQRYDALVRESWQGRGYFSGWFRENLNNADLVAIGAYTGGRCAFAGLLAKAEGDFPTFHELADAVARQSETKRRAWLDQPCATVAPAADL